jgi:hypothetical protein
VPPVAKNGVFDRGQQNWALCHLRLWGDKLVTDWVVGKPYSRVYFSEASVVTCLNPFAVWAKNAVDVIYPDLLTFVSKVVQEVDIIDNDNAQYDIVFI